MKWMPNRNIKTLSTSSQMRNANNSSFINDAKWKWWVENRLPDDDGRKDENATGMEPKRRFLQCFKIGDLIELPTLMQIKNLAFFHWNMLKSFHKDFDSGRVTDERDALRSSVEVLWTVGYESKRVFNRFLLMFDVENELIWEWLFWNLECAWFALVFKASDCMASAPLVVDKRSSTDSTKNLQDSFKKNSFSFKSMTIAIVMNWPANRAYLKLPCSGKNWISQFYRFRHPNCQLKLDKERSKRRRWIASAHAPYR